ARFFNHASAISAGGRAGYSLGVGQVWSHPVIYFSQSPVYAQRPVKSQKSCNTTRVGKRPHIKCSSIGWAFALCGLPAMTKSGVGGADAVDDALRRVAGGFPGIVRAIQNRHQIHFMPRPCQGSRQPDVRDTGTIKTAVVVEQRDPEIVPLRGDYRPRLGSNGV